ncbi:MAG: FtsX-like permease family protein [Lachnospiraceae bacterium]|nr:FtsX-like permease family protein [Lachnospiraceae bacterium]
MNYLQRAFCYISRKRLKSLLLFMIFMVVNCMVLGILGIQSASEEAMKDLRSNTESKVILESRQGEGQQAVRQFTEDDVQEILETPNINWINRMWSEQTGIPELTPVIVDEQSDQTFTIHLQNRVDKDSAFEEQIYRLVEGDFPSAGNEIVINKLLADQNGLQVGDDIQGIYRITGIFLSGTERQQTEKVATVNRIENQIYIMADENLSESCKGYTKVICYVKEPEKLDELVGAFDERYSEKAYVKANDHTYQKMRISIEQTGRITMFVLVITLITGCSVTGLLLSMWMRGRKTEIAVYVSLGLEKSDLFKQAVAEGLALYIISFVFSGILTYSLLPKLNSSLGISEGTGGSWKADYAGSLLILGYGVCVIMLLIVIAMFPYLKKHPKEILSEMEG